MDSSPNEDSKSVDECMRGAGKLLESDPRFWLRFEDIVSDQKRSPLRVAIPSRAVASPSASERSAVLPTHDTPGEEGPADFASLVTFDDRKKSLAAGNPHPANSETALVCGNGKQFDTVDSPTRKIHLIRATCRVQPPRTLQRNSPEVHHYKHKSMGPTESASVVAAMIRQKQEELKLPTLKLSCGKLQLAGRPHGSVPRSPLKASPYFAKNNLRHYSPEKARLIALHMKLQAVSAKNLTLHLAMTERAKSEVGEQPFPEFANSFAKSLDKMHREAKTRAIEKVDSLLSAAGEGKGKERVFFWTPDLNLYGFTTKEAVDKDMRMWRKKNAAA